MKTQKGETKMKTQKGETKMKTQEQMYYEAFAKRARVNEAFMEMVQKMILRLRNWLC